MRAFLFSILSGVLLALSLPPYDLSWLAFIALVPMLLAVRNLRPTEAAGTGLIVGLVAGIIHARWSGGLFLVFAYAPFLWFGVLCAIYAVVSNRVQNGNALRRAVILGCVGVLSEWLTTLTPLPINVAVTQHRVLALIQIADITGIWGVSFGIWLCNAAIAELWPRETKVTKKNPVNLEEIVRSTTAKKWVETPLDESPVVTASAASVTRRRYELRKPLFVAFCWLLLSLIYGIWKLSQPLENRALRVAAIQDYAATDQNGFADAIAVSSTQREFLTRQAVARGAQLVVWSEELLGSNFTPQNRNDETRNLAQALRTHLVAGYIDDSGQKLFNSAALLTPAGEIAAVHRKIHLYAGERSYTTPGTLPTVVKTAIAHVGIAICFDTCWTNVVRQEVNRGAQIIAMPNYDPPLPRGVVHYLHGAMLPFRAVENRVPIVRADPNGHSGAIDSRGRVLESLPLQRAGISVRDVRLGNGRGTFFSRLSDWFVAVCGCVLLITIARNRK